jgi:hypothetical protein
MKFPRLIGLASLLLAAPATAGVLEDFEHGMVSLYSIASGSGNNMQIIGSAAHDGALGAAFPSGSSPWYVRRDLTTNPGESYYSYVKLQDTGRIYVGVSADGGGCYSVVAAPNTSTLIIQDNSSWGYNDLTSAPVTWDTTGSTWYLMELEWATNGDMTARLWDESGTTKIAETATVSTGRTNPGMFAIRGFSNGGNTLDIDTIGTGETLTGSPASISASAGGAQALTLDAGSALAGNLYIIAGSVSGTAPGVPFQGETIPLNIDAYTIMTLSGGGGILISGVGTLNGLGQAVANFILPPTPSLAGIQVNHAAVVLDLGGTLQLVSNAAPCDLTP